MRLAFTHGGQVRCLLPGVCSSRLAGVGHLPALWGESVGLPEVAIKLGEVAGHLRSQGTWWRRPMASKNIVGKLIGLKSAPKEGRAMKINLAER